MNERTHLGLKVQSAFGCSSEKSPLSDIFDTRCKASVVPKETPGAKCHCVICNLIVQEDLDLFVCVCMCVCVCAFLS